MKLRSIGYTTAQGIKNIGRNRMFSFASIATMTASIFMLGAFLSIIMNVNAVREDLEEKVGITVFFENGTSDGRMEEIGAEIRRMEHVTEATFTSADEAWEKYKTEYLEGNEDLAEGFKENPLANSASYTVLVDKIENQDAVVRAIGAIRNVRRVNQSSGAARNLKSFNKLFTGSAIAIIVLLLIVTIILISNTVSVGISVRKDEIGIMKLIGATDSFVRAPFLVEGLLLGLIGSAIPLVILYFTYKVLIDSLLVRFGFMSSMGNVLLDVNTVFRYVAPLGLAIGIGVGLFGSILMVRRHLKV